MTEIFAHRGLHQAETENSVAAFLAAKAAGANGVELDVRRTQDGALVIHHDAAIEGFGAIAELACRDLPEGLATLEEAMTACIGMRVNVEIKNSSDELSFDPSGALAHEVVAALSELAWLDTVIISSFDLATCEAVRRADADVEIGWLTDWRINQIECVKLARERDFNAVHPYFALVDRALVELAHTGGLAINVWTVNAPEDIERMLLLEVDTLITDDPALAIATAATLARGR